MIGKVPAKRRDDRSSFKALVDYCLGVTGHSAGSVLHVGMQHLESLTMAAIEMEALATENTRCRDPVFHFILSWREMEVPTTQQVDEAVEIALKELDLQECQALWALQSDTENLHVHVAVNRIDPKTHRAIQPAGNWTTKALERAARKIEIAQGWEVERSGRYEVDANGGIREKGATERRGPEATLTGTARDIEAHTGQESLERTAKREVLPILQSAASWEGLHRSLAEHGFAFEKKGSGAVLISGENAVKVSTLSRDHSLKKLEARLGAFQERGADVKVVRRKARAVEPIEKDVKLKASWERYIEERAAYLAAKSRAFRELKAQQKEERRALFKRQREDRGEIFKESWKGRGRELNQLRSLYAYAHQRERLELMEGQQEELDELKSHYLQRFPSYKRWLADQKSEELFMVYRYPGWNILTPEQAGVSTRPRPMDLRDYTAKKGAGYSVVYCRSGKVHGDFSDWGRRIVLDRKALDETAVAAALQLANQKWGATKVNGSDEYKELCVAAAVKYGLKLANADLAAEVERRRSAMRGGTQEAENKKSAVAKVKKKRGRH